MSVLFYPCHSIRNSHSKFVGMETCNESVSSFFDDSSHSESNAKEDVCDGDDELTDFEGGNAGKSNCPSKLNGYRNYKFRGAISTKHQRSLPSRQKDQITAIMENNLSWSHNGNNYFLLNIF